jgi:hypothetical protein
MLLANAAVNKIARPPCRAGFHSPRSRRLNLRRPDDQEPVGFLLTGRVIHTLLLIIRALFPRVTALADWDATSRFAFISKDSETPWTLPTLG